VCKVKEFIQLGSGIDTNVVLSTAEYNMLSGKLLTDFNGRCDVGSCFGVFCLFW
jgi:hypothetical protein